MSVGTNLSLWSSRTEGKRSIGKVSMSIVPHHLVSTHGGGTQNCCPTTRVRARARARAHVRERVTATTTAGVRKGEGEGEGRERE